MKTSSAKNKGRILQKLLASKLSKLYKIEEGNFVSRPMGSPGLDLIVSPQVKEISGLDRHFGFECKNQESCNLRKEYELHAAKHPDTFNVLIHKKNHKKELAVMSLEDFLYLLGLIRGKGQTSAN